MEVILFAETQRQGGYSVWGSGDLWIIQVAREGHFFLYVAEYNVLWKFNEDASDRDAGWRR